MAKEENEFQKLLSEAPMAPSADTVTVMGALSRAADPARFVLTLPDGRSETLEVAAVKSAKKIAGAVGQSLVELELDAKKIPESVRDFLIRKDVDVPLTGARDWVNKGVPIETGVTDFHNTFLEHGGVGVPVGRGQEWPGVSPFVAAMPHQADPTTRAALELWANAFTGTRTYLNWNVWTGDQHHIVKARLDPP